MEWFVLLCTLFILSGIGFLIHFRKLLLSLWHEPVLRHPVVIFESDDWGPAEDFEMQRLEQLATMLESHHDNRGRHPVMTLGVVLSVPDSVKLKKHGCTEFYSRFLDDPEFIGIREAMEKGVNRGVFALQLHGMAHYLPEVLLKAARTDPQITDWLTGEGVADARQLPAPLQSRWIDGSQLPSLDLGEEMVEERASEEALIFKKLFDMAPRVAVPPTFIWTDEVEKGWAREGVKYVVTPGKRYSGRDARGKPVPVAGNIRNGQTDDSGRLLYLVRDEYFEPSYGHRAEEALRTTKKNVILGRPVLFEIHRFNFNGQRIAHEKALSELDRALQLILQNLPDTLFLSTEELGKALRESDQNLVDCGIITKTRFFLRRARLELPIIRRLFPVNV